MSKKHFAALISTMLYLIVVGFSDFPPKTVGPKPWDYIPMFPIDDGVVLQPNRSSSVLSYEDFIEKREAAKAISRKYKGVDFETAMQVTSLVYHEARTHKLDPKLVLALIATESSFNPDSLSIKGAKGYTQVIPKWHRDKILNRDIWDMKVNIEVGVKVLRDCFSRNRTEYSALACYNGATTPDKATAYKQAIDRNKNFFIAAVRQSNLG